jgi:hypothetical protein
MSILKSKQSVFSFLTLSALLNPQKFLPKAMLIFYFFILTFMAGSVEPANLILILFAKTQFINQFAVSFFTS